MKINEFPSCAVCEYMVDVKANQPQCRRRGTYLENHCEDYNMSSAGVIQSSTQKNVSSGSSNRSIAIPLVLFALSLIKLMAFGVTPLRALMTIIFLVTVVVISVFND